MIREIINPKTNKITVSIPACMMNKDLEVLVFPIPKDEKETPRKNPVHKLMKEVFRNAESVIVPKEINVDQIMDRMNDALS